IVDIRDAVLSGAEPAITDFKGVVGGVMTQTFKDGGMRTTRLLIQLLEPAEYAVSANKGGLRVVLHKAKETRASGAKVTYEKKKAATKKEAPREPDHATVDDVRFVHGESGDRIVIDLAGPVAHNVQARSSKRSVLVIRDAKLPKKLARRLDTTAYGGFVHG